MSTLVKLGSRGKTVAKLQQLLKEKGFLSDLPDGIFGPGTHRALKSFQKTNNLLDDGIAGKRTWEELRGHHIDTWQLTAQDVARAADQLGVELAAIKAVSEVESAGGGFVKEGQPKVLFERHWMNRRLNSRGLTLAAKLGRSERPDIVNTRTGGYRGGSLEWIRLQTARKLSDEAALESASYGRYQLMGFHWKNLGYPSVQDFVEKHSTNEGHQLDGFVKFILADSRLLKALKKKDWATFARVYNGPAYAKNKYDQKMAEAYERHSTI
jgi:hypothetical protein